MEELNFWLSKTEEELLSLGYSKIHQCIYTTTNKNGRLHSYEDRPASISPSGILWLNEGMDHREENKPDFIAPNGIIFYTVNDLSHRTDGPSMIWEDGRTCWYVNNVSCLTAKQFQELTGHSDEYMAELILKYGPIS